MTMSTIEFEYSPELDVVDVVASYVFPNFDLLLSNATSKDVYAIQAKLKELSKRTGYIYGVSVKPEGVLVVVEDFGEGV
jgi:hypothetical protein